MILQVHNLAFQYKKRCIFEHVNFSVEKGEIFSILGTNGAGKSTLLNCVVNIQSPFHGQIFLQDKPLTEYSIQDIARKVSYVPQNLKHIIDYNVRDYVVMGRSPYLKFFEYPQKMDYEIVEYTLEKLGINKFAFRSFSELSGGEQQLVRMAKALVQQPDLILLDEPTNNLDYGNQLRILQLIKQLSQEGMAIVLTSHIPDHVLLLGGKVGILNNGKLISGMCKNVLNEENLMELYDTEDIQLLYASKLHRVICAAGKNF